MTSTKRTWGYGMGMWDTQGTEKGSGYGSGLADGCGHNSPGGNRDGGSCIGEGWSDGEGSGPSTGNEDVGHFDYGQSQGRGELRGYGYGEDGYL